ncbi:kinesin-like protein KIF28P isoform X2 [Littorina saxatilis]|uniref:kinesin-like protein KIF28P isoform X2 n=1 Tax=Littorina saxatilis TaxID=31220 RepID=UPI0038B68A87
MNGATTSITDPNDASDVKKFAFDYSYWSHDGSKADANGYYCADSSHPNARKFCDQKKVYDDLGKGILDNAWEGYNSTLFAYGQTGSGKSWSIVGYGINKGVVPQFCEAIFQGIDAKKAEGGDIEFEVTFSMLEIYNEQVRDLLDPKGASKKGGLRIRQHPKNGFYPEGLQIVPVVDYLDIEKRMEEGTTNRTVAATNMNATSSRAHTIVGITFIQKFKNAAGEDTTKSALINLVDLAGSERAESTGATGDRLKEGAAINQSLSCLGNCISALADNSQGKNVKVPFRDSSLTKLLKNALGGNSKTIMIAALSPADINYEETLSTLRYADRAKQIKTKATVNEDPTDKLIRELQEENEKLKAMLSGDTKMVVMKDDDEDLSDAELAKLKEEMEEEYKSRLENNQKEMDEMAKSFEEKLKEAGLTGGNTGAAEMAEKRKTVPHIYNLNMDPQLTGHIVHFIDAAEITIGNGREQSTELVLKGPGIAGLHAELRKDDGDKYSLEPLDKNARTMLNGKAVVEKVPIKHNDRIVFGTTQYFVFCNPAERDAAEEPLPDATFEMAQEEIAKRSGFDVNMENKTRDERLLQEDIMELMPAVEQANSISEDLDKKMKFDIMIVSPEARGELKGRTVVMIRVTNLETKHEWIWSREKFLNRKFVMQEMYDNFQEGEEWDVPPEKDPFVDDYEAEFHIGSVKVWLKSLAYMIELREQLEITNFSGQAVGLLNIDIIPCDEKGKEYTDADDMFVEDPEQLRGKKVFLLVKITSARGLPNTFTDVYAKFLVYLDSEYSKTKPLPNTSNPDWNFKKVCPLGQVDDAALDYLQEGALMIQIWGKQKPPKVKKSVNTRLANLTDSRTKGEASVANTNVKRFDGDKMKYMMEATMLRKRQEKLENKLRHMREMLEVAEEHKKKKLRTKLISDIYHAPTEDAAQKCIKLIPLEKDEDEGESEVGSDSELSKDRDESNSSNKHTAHWGWFPVACLCCRKGKLSFSS